MREPRAGRAGATSASTAPGALRFQDGWCVERAALDNFIEQLARRCAAVGRRRSGRAALQHGEAVSPQTRPRSARALSTCGTGTACSPSGVVSGGKIDRRADLLRPQRARARPAPARRRRASSAASSASSCAASSAEESLRESEARFRSLTQMSSRLLLGDRRRSTASPQHRARARATRRRDAAAACSARPRWELPVGQPRRGRLGGAPRDAREPAPAVPRLRVRPRHARRHDALLRVSGEPRFAADGSFLGYRGVGRDVTEIALARERIASLAYSDPLTGLANRTSLGPALEQAVQRARRRAVRSSPVCSSTSTASSRSTTCYGHDAGDALPDRARAAACAPTCARATWSRASAATSSSWCWRKCRTPAPVESVANKLLARRCAPTTCPAGGQARVTASIGISIFPDDAADAAALMKHADTAMYAAKQAGKNAYCFFSSDSVPASATAHASVRPSGSPSTPQGPPFPAAT